MIRQLERRFPGLDEAERLVRDGRVLVDGFPVRNPRSLVRADARIAFREDVRLRGEGKLEAALEAFGVDVAGRVALDVGAAAGGFTRMLLRAGARRVYAVDVGFGQLLGSLRQDERVVVLERTNLAQLDRTLVPDVVEVVTIDVSYVALAAAVPQLIEINYAPEAELVTLVKPMFELGLAEPPEDEEQIDAALATAAEGIAAAGWRVVSTTRSPVEGRRGAVELLLHARRGG